MAYYIDKACLEKHQSIFKEIDEFLPKKQEIPQPQSNQQQNQKKEEIKVKDDKNSKPAKEVSDKNANSNKTKLSKKKKKFVQMDCWHDYFCFFRASYSLFN